MPKKLTRRELLTTTAAAGAGLASAHALGAQPTPMPAGPFKLRYAPHFGMFRNSAGADLVDQLKFAADEGFTAWEDNGMAGRSVADQERCAKAMTDLGILMGVFVAHAEWNNPMYALGGDEARAKLVQIAKDSVEVAKRTNVKWMTVVPGPYDKKLAWEFQTSNVIDNLRAMAEVFEPHGLVMVLEPLNPYRDHPGMFLTKVPQAHMICRAVNSPACKILFDMYHQQITEGNIIPNVDAAWSETAYFQVGDNPGRNEPGTGEMNYRNIFAHIHAKGFQGVMGMEHGNSKGGKEGEQAVIAAYRAADTF